MKCKHQLIDSLIEVTNYYNSFYPFLRSYSWSAYYIVGTDWALGVQLWTKQIKLPPSWTCRQRNLIRCVQSSAKDSKREIGMGFWDPSISCWVILSIPTTWEYSIISPLSHASAEMRIEYVIEWWGPDILLLFQSKVIKNIEPLKPWIKETKSRTKISSNSKVKIKT